MATMITSECINCGACEPECPNTAIYQGGTEWDFNGAKNAPLSNEIFYIVPEKCTECVGFFDHEACAAVCPVDCCVPNPDIPETEGVLIARAKQLHPGTDFPATGFPSRFGGAGGGEAAAPAADGAAPAAAPAPAAAAPAAAASAAPGLRIEKPLSAPRAAPPKPRAQKAFTTELPVTYEDAVNLTMAGRAGGAPLGLKIVALVLQPLLGALPDGQKRAIEKAVGDKRFFSNAGATGLNALQNMILYPILCAAFGAFVSHQFSEKLFTNELRWWAFLGMTLASIELIMRMKQGFQGRPVEEIQYGPMLLGLPLAVLAAPIVGGLKSGDRKSGIGQDGFRSGGFGDKLERERRYGEIYTLTEQPNGYLLHFEFPRLVPPSAAKEQMSIHDEMPDYDYDLKLQGNTFVVKGKVTDASVRKISAFSPAFPPDFTTQIPLSGTVAGFKHRFRGKDLEVALVRKF